MIKEEGHDSQVIDEVLDIFSQPRDSRRIDEVIRSLSDLWKQCPDLRFFQLIASISGQNDQFYTSDKDTLKLIAKTKFWMNLND